MKKCETCGTMILFGPVRRGTHVYCSYECRDKDQFAEATSIVSHEVAAATAKAINEGDCPKCGHQGPVDFQYSYTVRSALVLTWWKTIPEICCADCGHKAQSRAFVSSMILGWWGFPFGLILTPIQLFRNVRAMCDPPVHGHPSPDLEKVAKLMAADELHPGTNSNDDTNQT